MSDKSNTHTYNVYLPHVPDCYSVKVPADPDLEVMDLAKSIRENPEIQNVLKSNEAFRIFKYCKKYERPEEFHSTVVEWLSANRLGQQMLYFNTLGEYFKEGPAPRSEKQIDVIIAPDSFLKTLKPVTPENQGRPSVEHTPQKPTEQTQDLVEAFLEGRVAKLREYLSGPAWSEFWKAPPSADSETSQFIDSLRIPGTTTAPMLVLHDLGGDIVDPTVVDRVFTSESTFLVNTSGSGKTRLLFEGLIRYWGFYFTTVPGVGVEQLGSVDVYNTINTEIPGTKGFDPDPSSRTTEQDRRGAFESNHLIAKRRIHQNLIARIIIFEWFLKTAREKLPNASADSLRERWLYLQLLPTTFFGGEDVFSALSKILTDASNNYLGMGAREINGYLSQVLERYQLGKKFYLVLDEAQRTLGKAGLDRCFCSESNMSTLRPVLRPILKSWMDAVLVEFCPIILSGTGISMAVVSDVCASLVVKSAGFDLVKSIGAFDNQEIQKRYMLRYMPPKFVQSESGAFLIERAWNFVRGRHRFTARLMRELLRYGFQSPHRMLDLYIEVLCGFTPTDGRRFIVEETNMHLKDKMKTDVFFLDFKQILEDRERFILFSNIIYTWLMWRQTLNIHEKFSDLVELGFARFSDPKGLRTVVDEPIIILAAARHFEAIKFPLGAYFWQDEDSTKKGETGHSYKGSIAYYLACAIDQNTPLREILDFGEQAPEWANHPAKLVSISRRGGKLEADQFNLWEYKTATSALGCKHDGYKATVNWFRNPNSLMCFPDNLMGPDIVLFIRLRTGLIVAVIVQCKSSEKLYRGQAAYATSTLDLNRIYQRGNTAETSRKENKDAVLSFFGELNTHEITEEWFEDGMPVLRVVATPNEVSLPPRHAGLKKDRYEAMRKAVTSEYLKVLSSGIKRNRDDDRDDDSTNDPNKRPR